MKSLLGSLQSHELHIKEYDFSPLEQTFQTQLSFRGGSRGRKGRGFHHGRRRNNVGRYQELEKGRK